MAKNKDKGKFKERGGSTESSNREEIKKLNERLAAGISDPKEKAKVEGRVKFLGGTPASAPTVTQPPPPPPPAPEPTPTPEERYAKDVAAGKSFYDTEIAPELEGEFLGRIGATTYDPVLEKILAMREGGLEGYTAAENLALREAATQGLNNEFQTQLRALAGNLGRVGFTGGAAGQRAVPLVGARNQAQQGLERDLFIENVAEKQRRLQGLQDYAQAQQKTDLGIQEFNLGQQAGEKAAKVGGKFNAIGTTLGSLAGYRAEDIAKSATEDEKARQKEYMNFVASQNQQNLDALIKSFRGNSLNI